MSYINCGVWVDGKRPPSKRALREALRQDAPDQIQDGDTLTVVGPDPYRNRKWYASVTRDPDTGRIVVR